MFANPQTVSSHRRLWDSARDASQKVEASVPALTPCQQTMATTNTNSVDFGVAEQIDKRDLRALAECMTVLPEGGSLFTVVGENGESYTVDAKKDRCTCQDYQHNLPDGDRETCKHRARLAFATGERPIPAYIDMDSVDDLLGEQLPRSQPRVAMTDGGLFRESPHRFETDRVDDGPEVLVYGRDDDELGRRLVGFSHPDGAASINWATVRDELARLGLGVGAIHEKEVFEPEEVGL